MSGQTIATIAVLGLVAGVAGWFVGFWAVPFGLGVGIVVGALCGRRDAQRRRYRQ